MNLVTPISTPPSSRPLSPPHSDEKLAISPQCLTSRAVSESCSEEEPGTDDDDPEALTAKYLTLKRRLYNLDPSLEQTKRKAPAKPKTHTCTDSSTNGKPNVRVARLQQKVLKIENDILFEREAAQSQWMENYKELVKEDAERRRLQLKDKTSPSQRESSSDPSKGHPRNSLSIDSDSDSDAVDVLADLFSGAEVGTSSSSAQHHTSEDERVTIRDFGKFTGLKPRRVLEEACKAR